MSGTTLTLGFLPLLDCAPLVVAVHKGFGEAEGLDLRLVRENSWANIRDRLIVGHFDAAHMLGPMTIATTLGIGHLEVPMIAPIALGAGANAITASAALWRQMQLCGASTGAGPRALGEVLAGVVATRRRRGLAALVFGMVYPFSVHNYALRYWLAACGIDPERDVRLVVLPPPLISDALREGQIDGCCVGEPWNSLAVESGAGSILMPTAAIWRAAPDKVLGMRADRARCEPAELGALLRAVYRATVWCEDPANHAELARLLAEPRHVGAPRELLQRALAGELRLVAGQPPVAMPGFRRAAQEATVPETAHALWIYSQMVRWGQTAYTAEGAEAARGCFRPDLLHAAQRALMPPIATDATPALCAQDFFDARVFDPERLGSYLDSFAAHSS